MDAINMKMKNTTILLCFFCVSSLFGQSPQLNNSGRLIFGTHEERTASIGMGDIDNDGDLDALIANGRHWPGQNRIFFNNGFGKFSVSKPLGEERATSYSTELADFDNDGDLDVAVGNDMAPNSLFLNDGKGNFTKVESFGKSYAPTRNIIVADIDSDGDADILITNRGRENEICLNNGSGIFDKNLGFGAKDDSTIDVEVADIDQDGDKDLILANRDEQQNYVYLNDGELNFSEKIPYGSGDDNTRSVAVEDINEDGYLDILTANIGSPNSIYFGSVDLQFTKHIVFDTSADASSSITIGDLNLDGKKDIVIGNFKQPNHAFINSENGMQWKKIKLSKNNSFTYDILVQDLNNDGKNDIVESNSDELNRYYLNRTIDPILENVMLDGTFLIYRRQSMIGEESYKINSKDGIVTVNSLQGENERGRISGVPSELHLDKKNLEPIYYNSRRIANEDTTNILKITLSDDQVSIWEKHFEVKTSDIPTKFFPVHSNIPAGIEMMVYHYYFRQGEQTNLKTLPRGELSIMHRGQDVVSIKGKEIILDRYVVEGINWGGRTVWLDEDKNLIALVKANTQIREIIRKGYEEAMPTFIAGHVEEQMAALNKYTIDHKKDQANTLALVGGNVISGLSDVADRDMTILIKNGKIAEIGKSKEVSIPSGSSVINVEGKTLMPGLWDMHAHSNQVQWAPAYLAGGVTTIRDNGNEVEFATAFRDAIARQGKLGPDILLAGMTDGPGKKGNGIIRATNPQEAREVVDMYLSKGYKQIKIYNSLSPEVLHALAREAHKRNVTVTGHIPSAVETVQHAVELGMDMFSHNRAIYSALYPEKTKKDLLDVFKDNTEIEPERITYATKFFLDNNIVLDPTMNLMIIRAMTKGDLIESVEPDAHRIAYELWEAKRFRGGLEPELAKRRVAKYTKCLEIIGQLFKAGVPIVAGTDNAVPVFSLYLELESYQNLAKLTPLEVIQTATIIPAKAMGMDAQTGSLEIGKEADIAILDKNPLENISNIRTVSAVISNGNYYESNPLWEAADYLPRDGSKESNK